MVGNQSKRFQWNGSYFLITLILNLGIFGSGFQAQAESIDHNDPVTFEVIQKQIVEAAKSSRALEQFLEKDHLQDLARQIRGFYDQLVNFDHLLRTTPEIQMVQGSFQQLEYHYAYFLREMVGNHVFRFSYHTKEAWDSWVTDFTILRRNVPRLVILPPPPPPPPTTGPRCTLEGYGIYAGGYYNYRVNNDGTTVLGAQTLDFALSSIRKLSESSVCHPRHEGQACALMGYGMYAGANYNFGVRIGSDQVLGRFTLDAVLNDLGKLQSAYLCEVRPTETCGVEGYGMYAGSYYNHRVRIGSNTVLGASTLTYALDVVKRLKAQGLCL